jgi:hypothetical protein
MGKAEKQKAEKQKSKEAGKQRKNNNTVILKKLPAI